MRILHISDFHLDKQHQDDSVRYIVNPLLSSLKKLSDETRFDLVLFTGDLVNMAGSSYGTIDTAFAEFEKIFVVPLLQTLHLSREYFFFVPGNHDVDRSVDS